MQRVATLRLRSEIMAGYVLSCYGCLASACQSEYVIVSLYMVSFYCFVTKACARRSGAAASMERRQRERRTLLAGAGRRASRSDTLAASQAFECMHIL